MKVKKLIGSCLVVEELCVIDPITEIQSLLVKLGAQGIVIDSESIISSYSNRYVQTDFTINFNLDFGGPKTANIYKLSSDWSN